MGRHHRPVHGDRLTNGGPERGSALVESVAGLAVAFLLLTVLAQAGFGLVARNTAEAGVAAAARQAALPGADPDAAASELVALLAATVPGATGIETAATFEAGRVVVSAAFSWDPPGPRWTQIRFTVRRSAALVVPP